MAERSLAQRLAYRGLRVVTRLTLVTVFAVRYKGRENIPDQGGGLICANHQSFFDPPLIGSCFNRRLNYLARKTLFRFSPFRWLIEFFDAIPIDREGSGLSGLKETLRRLKRGEFVLIFPEGTRSHDGQVSPLKPGFVAMARRSRVPLLPVGLDGAYDAWPRRVRFPRRARIHVCVGPPLEPEMVASLSDAQLVAELERRIRACHAAARQGRSS